MREDAPNLSRASFHRDSNAPSTFLWILSRAFSLSICTAVRERASYLDAFFLVNVQLVRGYRLSRDTPGSGFSRDSLASPREVIYRKIALLRRRVTPLSTFLLPFLRRVIEITVMILPSEDVSKGSTITMNGNTNYHVGQQIFYMYGEQMFKKLFADNKRAGILENDYLVTTGMGAHKIHGRKLTWNKARKACIEEGGKENRLREMPPTASHHYYYRSLEPRSEMYSNNSLDTHFTRLRFTRRLSLRRLICANRLYESSG